MINRQKLYLPYMNDFDLSTLNFEILNVLFSNGAPNFDRSTKPDHFTSTGFSGLRQVIVPSDLMRKFMVLAEHNTLRNIETCGILAGKMVRN